MHAHKAFLSTWKQVFAEEKSGKIISILNMLNVCNFKCKFTANVCLTTVISSGFFILNRCWDGVYSITACQTKLLKFSIVELKLSMIETLLNLLKSSFYKCYKARLD